MIAELFKNCKQRKVICIHLSESVIKLRTVSTTKYCKIINGEFIKINTIAHFEDNYVLGNDFHESVYSLTRTN